MTSDRLALDGGEPVRRELLPYGRQALTDDDIATVVQVLRSDWLTTGPKVAEFEEAIADFVGAAHAVSFSSGTAALHGAVLAAGVGPGDEVITSPLTFCATANCVLYQGATPVFADVSDDTLNLDPDDVSRRLSPRAKAILPVDYGGHPADLDEFLALADRDGLTVIEDAAHALGARYRGRRVGSISHMTVFSFHPVKHVTTGEGGMVTTNDATHARRLRMCRNHGIDSDARARQASGQWYYEMTALGCNYRLTDIASALGLSQMSRLDTNVERRRTIARQYAGSLAAIPGLRLPHTRSDAEPAWHLYPVRVDPHIVRGERDEIFRALRAEGLGVNVHYIPVHLHPYYRQRFGDRSGWWPIAEQASRELISLPMFHAMSDGEAQDVVAAVRKVMRHFVADPRTSF
ncbi:MAG: UDP-4-amino-4,6-dideoxy-N-acetyl-beta-L-altrosamine transaminase [SAR202 cluster bacterium]|nr:UDP-4-amino-4,6-dideoxy-N-acetyl-beta-L-altrosamine transaminase [SAR202 cluster bacterium]